MASSTRTNERTRLQHVQREADTGLGFVRTVSSGTSHCDLGAHGMIMMHESAVPTFHEFRHKNSFTYEKQSVRGSSRLTSLLTAWTKKNGDK